MKYQYSSIPKAAERWPDSKAHAFSFEKANQKHFYFMVEPPDFRPSMERPDKNRRAMVKCVKFFQDTGNLIVTNVPIANNAELKDHTIKEFNDMVMAKLKEILENPDNYPKDILKMYEFLQFYKKSKRPSKH